MSEAQGYRRRGFVVGLLHCVVLCCVDEDNGDDESKLEDSCSSMTSKEEQYCVRT